MQYGSSPSRASRKRRSRSPTLRRAAPRAGGGAQGGAAPRVMEAPRAAGHRRDAYAAAAGARARPAACVAHWHHVQVAAAPARRRAHGADGRREDAPQTRHELTLNVMGLASRRSVAPRCERPSRKNLRPLRDRHTSCENRAPRRPPPDATPGSELSVVAADENFQVRPTHWLISTQIDTTTASGYVLHATARRRSRATS